MVTNSSTFCDYYFVQYIIYFCWICHLIWCLKYLGYFAPVLYKIGHWCDLICLQKISWKMFPFLLILILIWFWFDLNSSRSISYRYATLPAFELLCDTHFEPLDKKYKNTITAISFYNSLTLSFYPSNLLSLSRLFLGTTTNTTMYFSYVLPSTLLSLSVSVSINILFNFLLQK